MWLSIFTITMSPELPHSCDTTECQFRKVFTTVWALGFFNNGRQCRHWTRRLYTHNSMTNMSGSSYILAAQTMHLKQQSPSLSKSDKPNDACTAMPKPLITLQSDSSHKNLALLLLRKALHAPSQLWSAGDISGLGLFIATFKASNTSLRKWSTT